jgi:hypothetical protein
MRTRDIDDAEGSYGHQEEIISLHVSMGNVETKSNGRRYSHDPVSLRSMQTKVKRYSVDNERIMKS